MNKETMIQSSYVICSLFVIMIFSWLQRRPTGRHTRPGRGLQEIHGLPKGRINRTLAPFGRGYDLESTVDDAEHHYGTVLHTCRQARIKSKFRQRRDLNPTLPDEASLSQ